MSQEILTSKYVTLYLYFFLFLQKYYCNNIIGDIDVNKKKWIYQNKLKYKKTLNILLLFNF